MNSQILHALMEWRDSSPVDADVNDKIQKLLAVLADEDIGRLDLVEELRDYYNITE